MYLISFFICFVNSGGLGASLTAEIKRNLGLSSQAGTQLSPTIQAKKNRRAEIKKLHGWGGREEEFLLEAIKGNLTNSPHSDVSVFNFILRMD